MIERQKSYSQRYLRFLEWRQCESRAPSQKIQLSFYPIAKNIRWVGAALRKAANAGMRIEIASGNPRESRTLERDGLGPWNPWLWSRVAHGQLDAVNSGEDDRNKAWPTFFLPLDAPSADRTEAIDERPRWRNGDGHRVRRILEIAASTRYAFRLNSRMQSMVRDHGNQIGWSDTIPKIAIHLRRGDATSDDIQLQTRMSWKLEDYLSSADIICGNYEQDTIYLSTESQSEIGRAKESRPQYRFIALDHDRSVFPRIENTSKFIEEIALRDSSIVEPIVNSAIADLHFLRSCDAFIGTFNSEFSILAWLLLIGEKGYVVPYVDLAHRQWMRGEAGRLHFALN